MGMSLDRPAAGGALLLGMLLAVSGCVTSSCRTTGQCGASVTGMLTPQPVASPTRHRDAAARRAVALLTSISTDPPTRPPLLAR